MSQRASRCCFNGKNLVLLLLNTAVIASFSFLFVWESACLHVDEEATKSALPLACSVTYRNGTSYQEKDMAKMMKERFEVKEHVERSSLFGYPYSLIISEDLPKGKALMNTTTYLSLGVEGTYTDPTFLFNEVERAIQIDQSLPDFVVQISPYVDFEMGLTSLNVRLPFKNGGLTYGNVTILPDLNNQLSDEQALFSKKIWGDSFSFPSLNDYLDDKNYDQSSFFDLSSVFPFSFVWEGEGEQDLDESNVYLSFSNYELLLSKCSFYTKWVFEGNPLNEPEFDRLGDNRLFYLAKESRGYFPNININVFRFWKGLYAFIVAFLYCLWVLFVSISYRFSFWESDLRLFMRNGSIFVALKRYMLFVISPMLVSAIAAFIYAPSEMYLMSALRVDELNHLLLVPFWQSLYADLFLLFVLGLSISIGYFVFSYRQEKMVLGVRRLSA